MRPIVPLALCAALALSACGSREESTATPEQTEAEPSDWSADYTPYQAPTSVRTGTAQAFVDRIASAELFNVEAGKIAMERGKSAGVKAYAERMGRNRGNSTDALREAAARGPTGLVVTPALSPEQQARLERLRNAGTNFDQVYAMQQTEALAQTLDTLRAYAVGNGDPALQKFASDTALIAARQLENARELR